MYLIVACGLWVVNIHDVLLPLTRVFGRGFASLWLVCGGVFLLRGGGGLLLFFSTFLLLLTFFSFGIFVSLFCFFVFGFVSLVRKTKVGVFG